MAFSPHNRWRTNVAAVIMDKQGRVLLGKASPDARYWHFPQGGVSRKESLSDALQREVEEEVGLRPSQYRVICSVGGYRYQYKDSNEKSARWKGQEQTYFLLLCHDAQPTVDVSQTEEFGAFTWMPWRQLDASLFVPFKRGTIAQVLGTFFPSTFPDEGFHAALEQQLSFRRYMLGVGEHASLETRDSKDRALFAGGKAEAHTALNLLYRDIHRLHEALVSKRKGRLLILCHGVERCGCEGVVQRLAQHMEPFGVRVVSFPHEKDDERRSYDFIYPLHRRVPAQGEAVLMDRSVYNSLRLEALSGDISPKTFVRRLHRLNEFEQMLAEEGTHLLKLYLHISRNEQKKRFAKQHFYVQPRRRQEEQPSSGTETWNQEIKIAEAILSRVNSPLCPWYIIPSNKKWYRDFCVANIVIDVLQKMLLK